MLPSPVSVISKLFFMGLNFDHITAPQKTVTQVRNQKEDMIEQIVQQCTGTPTEKKNLAKLIALTANTAGWTAQDLHALLKKRSDPTIRNYTGFVRWSIKMKKR